MAAVLRHLRALPKLETLDLSLTGVTDDDLKYLQDLKSLRRLELHSTDISDAGLAHLRRLKKLELLRLGSTKVTDAGLTQLKSLTGLKTLMLGGNITDAGLEHLMQMRQLQSVSLGETKMTVAGAVKLRRALPDVNLDVAHSDWYLRKATPEQRKALAWKPPRVETWEEPLSPAALSPDGCLKAQVVLKRVQPTAPFDFGHRLVVRVTDRDGKEYEEAVRTGDGPRRPSPQSYQVTWERSGSYFKYECREPKRPSEDDEDEEGVRASGGYGYFLKTFLIVTGDTRPPCLVQIEPERLTPSLRTRLQRAGFAGDEITNLKYVRLSSPLKNAA